MFAIATFFIFATIIGIVLLTCESEVIRTIFSNERLTSNFAVSAAIGTLVLACTRFKSFGWLVLS